MKILLINPPSSGYIAPNCFPLGLAYIARVLRDAGHNVSALDVYANGYSFDETYRIILKEDFDVVGITGLVTQYSFIKKLCARIKQAFPQKAIIIGGSIASTMYKLLLEKTEADICVIGEGEITIVELISAIETGKDLKAVKGIAYESVVTEPRELIADIDTIPFPAWDLFPVEKYVEHAVTGYEKTRNMAILTSRGCPFRCTFCYDTFGKRTRFRSAANVIAEIKELQRLYGINRISPYDETFTVNRQRAIDICNLVINEKLNITWDCSGRVNCIDRALLLKLKEAGCTHILYGIESGSQTILNEMMKGVTVEQAHEAIQMTREVGIEMITPLMIGFPSESKETIDESVAFFKKENIYCGIAFFPTPHPGAMLYEYAKQKGLIKDEEKYIENLSEFTNLNVNLTSMSDDELIGLKKDAEHRIFIAYFFKHLHTLPARMIKQIKSIGLKGFLGNVKVYLSMVNGERK